MPHFDLQEFVRSDIATARKIDNALPRELVPAAMATLDMMERIRAYLCQHFNTDVPVNISSGYRCPELNYSARNPNGAAGRDTTGDHPKAAAVDWTASSVATPIVLARLLAPQVGTLGIGQLIYEHPSANRQPWIHTSTIMPAKSINRIISVTPRGTVAGITE